MVFRPPIALIGCLVFGVGCYRVQNSSEDDACASSDIRACRCDEGTAAGIQRCDNDLSEWDKCDCSVDTETGRLWVAYNSADFSVDWERATSPGVIDTDATSALVAKADTNTGTGMDSEMVTVIDAPPSTESASVSENVKAVEAATCVLPDTDPATASAGNPVDLFYTAEGAEIPENGARNTDPAYVAYRERVPDYFLLTVPDEMYGNGNLQYTIIDSDPTNDTLVDVEGYGQLPLGADCLFEMIYPDNGTIRNIAGRDALTVHARAMDRRSNFCGPSVEFSIAFDEPVDMRPLDYHYSFDVYVPRELADTSPMVQFALFDSTLRGCLYSDGYGPSAYIGNDVEMWVNFSGNIDLYSSITYSSLDSNPDDWIFQSFRIQLMLTEAYYREDTGPIETLFYVSNIKIWRG